MSLFKKWTAGRGGKAGIWHITESLEQLLGEVRLPPAELKALDAFSYEHRKKEWLAARILTEQLSAEKNTRIIYDEYNKPYLQSSKIHISLSHSHNLLAVILDDGPTGIDIELIKPKILAIKEKFMAPAELGSLHPDNLAEQLTVYWCAKEALYKLYGKKELTFKENLPVEPFHLSDKGILKGWIKNAAVHKRFSLQYEKMSSGSESYMLAYIIGQD